MNFEAPLENIFKQLELLRFPVKCWHRCGERFWWFGNSVDIVMQLSRNVFVSQQLKGQQNLVCFNHRRVILTAGGIVVDW